MTRNVVWYVVWKMDMFSFGCDIKGLVLCMTELSAETVYDELFALVYKYWKLLFIICVPIPHQAWNFTSATTCKGGLFQLIFSIISLKLCFSLISLKLCWKELLQKCLPTPDSSSATSFSTHCWFPLSFL